RRQPTCRTSAAVMLSSIPLSLSYTADNETLRSSCITSYAAQGDGCIRHTTNAMRSTSEENRSLCAYCCRACWSKSALIASVPSAYSSSARVITVMGVFCANRSNTALRIMVSSHNRSLGACPAARDDQIPVIRVLPMRRTRQGRYAMLSCGVRNSVTLKGVVDRNAQFEHINAQAAAFLVRGDPIISVDTKKKELVGNFKNNG